MGGPPWVASPRDRNGLLDERCFLLRKPGDLDLLKLMLAFSFGDKGRLVKYWCLLCLIEAVGPRLSSMWLGIGPPPTLCPPWNRSNESSMTEGGRRYYYCLLF